MSEVENPGTDDASSGVPPRPRKRSGAAGPKAKEAPASSPGATAPEEGPGPVDPEEPILVDPDTASADSDEEAQETTLDTILAEDPAIAEVIKAVGRGRDRDHERQLLREFSALDPDDPRRKPLRDELVTLHLPLVEHLARRFRDRGEPHDDLVQVGTIGLIKAVDRFDSERGVEFSTYATPTIVGEIKRHFRDKGWMVRVPRRMQEMRIITTRASAELSHSTGRSPTVRELAAHLNVSEEEVLEGLQASQAYSAMSLDASTSDESGESATISDSLGMVDMDLEGVENRESLRPLLAALPQRDRDIIAMRFFGHMTQSQIAQEVGISQMHVSRLLARSLAQLREGLLADA